MLNYSVQTFSVFNNNNLIWDICRMNLGKWLHNLKTQLELNNQYANATNGSSLLRSQCN